MHSLYISCFGKTIKLESNNKELILYFLNNKQEVNNTFPSLDISVKSCKYVFSVIVEDSKSASVTAIVRNKDVITIKSRLPKLSETDYLDNDIRIVLLSVFDYIFQETDSRYLLHASAVCINGKTIILSGDSGSGKTSIAVKLAIDCGAKFVGDNQVVIGQSANKPVIFSGTVMPELRECIVRQCFPDLIPYFDANKYYEGIISARPILKDKVINIEKPQSIDYIFFPQLLPQLSTQEMVFTAMAPEKLKRKMYFELSRNINGSNLLLALNCPVPRFTDELLDQKRFVYAEILARNVKGFIVSGGMENIVDKILTTIK